MPFSLFTKGIDEIVESSVADTVGFHVLGEPLLYPQIIEAVAYANQNGLSTTLTTNGSLLTRDKVSQLIQAGLTRLNISLQRFGAAEHACRRAPLPFDRYYQIILDAVEQINSSKDQICLSVFLMNNATRRFFNVEMPMQMTWNQSALRKGLTSLIHDLTIATGNPVSLAEVKAHLSSRLLRPGTQISITPRIRVTIKPFIDWGNAFTTSKIYPARHGFCGLAFSTLSILRDGEVIICCGDHEGKTSLGNLASQSLESILRSSRSVSIATGFSRFKIIHPRCQQCLGSSSPIKTAMKSVASTCLFKVSNIGSGKPIRAVELFY